ncbi:hypothetical protein GE107_07975 [Cohnella sp. CFH 77786]|uniref:hypothetical protein n=1 Tax=Cohnella sp. CFH 77786 TaxID=2662265 RepID=UPI001C60EF2C|nr:hypothetical protein [Cohnella sp. CFH 77786]MBW5445996.1 hypothetical protein [Cohnella sp. CFH 77786]
MVNRQMSRTLKWIAAIVVTLGIVCCISNMAEFNDRNLGLMVGIGFLVGGLQILVFGAIAPLMQRRQEENVIGETAQE